MSACLRVLLASAIALCSTGAVAAEVEQVSVVRDGARFHVEMRVRLSVPPDEAYTIFTHYPDLPRINPSVREVASVERRGHLDRVDAKLHICIAFFCRNLRFTQDMEPVADGPEFVLIATVVPEMSDFRYGRASWIFAPCASGTCLRFTAELEPDFWIPPLIGTWLMKRELRYQALATSEGIERLAHETR